MPLPDKYLFELNDGPLDGLKLVTRNFEMSFPAMLSFTFVFDDRDDICRVEHYKFLFQYLNDNNERQRQRGAVYMHQKTVEVNVAKSDET